MPGTSVRRRIALLSRSSELFDLSCASAPCEAGEGEDVRAGLLEERPRIREPVLELGDDPVVVLLDPSLGRAGGSRVHQCRDERLGRFSGLG